MFYSKLILKILNFFDFFQQRKIIKLINSRFSKPIIVFDIGAHHGETIKLFCKNLSIKKIYSFEASPQNYQILEKNFSSFQTDKVEIYNYGIGDKISKDFINQTIESSSSTINKLNRDSKYFEKKLRVLNVEKESFYQKLPITI